jgi:hypothetical protein
LTGPVNQALAWFSVAMPFGEFQIKPQPPSKALASSSRSRGILVRQTFTAEAPVRRIN